MGLRRYWYLGVCIAVLASALIFSASVSGMSSTLVGCFVLFLTRGFRLRTVVGVAAALAVVYVIAISVQSNGSHFNLNPIARIEQTTGTNTGYNTVNPRVATLEHSWSGIVQSPVIGHGLDQATIAVYYDADVGVYYPAHNIVDPVLVRRRHLHGGGRRAHDGVVVQPPAARSTAAPADQGRDRARCGTPCWPAAWRSCSSRSSRPSSSTVGSGCRSCWPCASETGGRPPTPDSPPPERDEVAQSEPVPAAAPRPPARARTSRRLTPCRSCAGSSGTVPAPIPRRPRGDQCRRQREERPS